MAAKEGVERGYSSLTVLCTTVSFLLLLIHPGASRRRCRLPKTATINGKYRTEKKRCDRKEKSSTGREKKEKGENETDKEREREECRRGEG